MQHHDDDFKFSKEHYETLKDLMVETRDQALLTNGRVTSLETFRTIVITAAKAASTVLLFVVLPFCIWFLIEAWKYYQLHP